MTKSLGLQNNPSGHGMERILQGMRGHALWYYQEYGDCPQYHWLWKLADLLEQDWAETRPLATVSPLIFPEQRKHRDGPVLPKDYQTPYPTHY